MKFGVCVMSTNAAWMANRTLFEKKDDSICDQLGRFELWSKKFNPDHLPPKFIDWHEKSVSDLKNQRLFMELI